MSKLSQDLPLITVTGYPTPNIYSKVISFSQKDAISSSAIILLISNGNLLTILNQAWEMNQVRGEI